MANDSPTTILDLNFSGISLVECVHRIVTATVEGKGGWLLTPNTSILRKLQDREMHWILDRATEIVPDGQPLLWLAWVSGRRIGPRVTGSDVLARVLDTVPMGTTVLLCGGPSDSIRSASRRLQQRGIDAFTDIPPAGFDANPNGAASHAANLANQMPAPPQLTVMALPFPRQEYLAQEISNHFPNSYFLNTGGALGFYGGEKARAPKLFQRLGLEWMYRLAQEPKRLAARYLLHDLPYLVVNLFRCGISRFGDLARAHRESD